jgi:hypothetical protein
MLRNFDLTWQCAWQDGEGSPTTRIIYRYSPVPIRPAPQREKPDWKSLASSAPLNEPMPDPFTSGTLTSVDVQHSALHHGMLPRSSAVEDPPHTRFINPPSTIETPAKIKEQYVPFPRGYHPVALPIKQIGELAIFHVQFLLTLVTDALDVVREMVPSNMRLSLISNP